MIRVVALFLALLAAGPAAADDRQELVHRLKLLRAYRARLEHRLGAQAERIRVLKGHPRGVTRDYQLRAALRGSQQIVRRLDALRIKLRSIAENLVAVYQQQLAASKDLGERASLERRIRELRGRRTTGKIVTDARTRPLDGADDVEARADLLKDSEEKVRRQVRRLERRLAQLRLRSKLRRHDRAAEDSLFIEGAPRRKSQGRSKSASGEPPPKSPGGSKRTGTDSPSLGPKSGVAPPGPPSNSLGAGGKPKEANQDGAFNSRGTGGGGSYTGGNEVAVGDRSSPAAAAAGVASGTTDVVDPSLLRRLESTGLTGNVRDRIAALRAASARLKRLAKRLSSKASRLRRQAKKLRKRK